MPAPARAPQAATCREFIGRLDDYVEEDLPVEARGRLDRHVAHCRCCAAYVRSYSRTVEMGRAALIAAAASAAGRREAEVPERLVQAVLSARAM